MKKSIKVEVISDGQDKSGKILKAGTVFNFSGPFKNGKLPLWVRSLEIEKSEEVEEDEIVEDEIVEDEIVEDEIVEEQAELNASNNPFHAEDQNVNNLV